MTKGLIALRELRKQCETHKLLEQQFEKEWLDTIEKELKAFEIIKECKEVICLRKEYDEELYTPEEIEKEGGQKYYLTDGSDGYRCYELTKEKYDLIKEVLSCD
jgi:hypothetical protein